MARLGALDVVSPPVSGGKRARNPHCSSIHSRWYEARAWMPGKVGWTHLNVDEFVEHLHRLGGVAHCASATPAAKPAP